jgi:Domain of unknown function (DUF4402)
VGTKWGFWTGRALCALAAAFAATPVLAASGSAAGKAITLRPLSIVKLGDLDFATNVPSATAGTIVIDPNTDVRTVTGGVTAAGGTPKAAQFYTYATANKVLQITRGALPVLTNGSGGTMNVTQLTLNGPTLRTVTAAGLLDLRVGGTLAVGANQLPGTYTGTFQINADYF